MCDFTFDTKGQLKFELKFLCIICFVQYLISIARVEIRRKGRSECLVVLNIWLRVVFNKNDSSSKYILCKSRTIRHVPVFMSSAYDARDMLAASNIFIYLLPDKRIGDVTRVALKLLY